MNRCQIHLLCGLLPFAPGTVTAGGDAARNDGRFGVMTHFAHGWDPALIASVAQSGVGSVRDEIYWRDVEPQKGVFQIPARYEQMMATLARRGIDPFVVLSFEHEAYDAGDTPHSDGAIAAYARYASELVRRFPQQIKAVEIWNEYNGAFVRGPAVADRAATYLRMLRATYQELKRLRPDVVVVGGGTAGVPLPYWEKLLAGGALDFMDVLSVHPYRYDDAPEGLETDLREFAALVKKYNHGRPKPVWVTEIGWNARAAERPGEQPIDDRRQAQFLVRAYALLFSAGVDRVYWYLFRDYNEAQMGLVRADEANSRKPAFTAMAALAHQLRDATFVARDESPPEIYSLCFRRPTGESVRVMWSTEPRRVAVTGVTGVTDMLGRSLGSSGELNLSESPIYVAGEIGNLPPRTTEEVADSRRGFGEVQGNNGWRYGRIGGDGEHFTPLPTFGADDWRATWTADLPHLSISAKEQHPSVQNGQPVSAVRRWESDRAGLVRVAGSFRGGKTGGDGVGVSVVVNGQRRSRTVLGGAPDRAVVETFNFVERVGPGTTIDLVVDPGPAANIDFDTTVVAMTITTTDSS
jgi:hypothetical protein